MTFSPPASVLSIVRRLEEAGHEAWCVGGAVRDALLGIQHLDWDIATSAKPPQVRRLFRRTIPVGIEFGTVGVLDDDKVLHEVTTFRRDVKTDGRHAEVEYGVSLEDDLARRDFTINAIAYSPTRDELRDPFGGRRDLDHKVIRAVGEPAARMREDRLRALRAIRFAARFEFALEKNTWSAIVGSAPYLRRLSAERVKQEIEKTMEQVHQPSRAFELWRTSGAFGELVPVLANVDKVTLSAGDHLPRPTMRTRPARKVLRLASLFSGVDAQEARDALRALRFSNDDTNSTARILAGLAAVRNDMESALADATVPDVRIRRWVARVGRTQWTYVMRLACAIWSARASVDRRASVPRAERVRSVYRRGLRIAFSDPVEIADLAVDGDDLRMAGVPTGPQIGKSLVMLLDKVLDDPALNTREQLLALLPLRA